jgi:hypothetical protein
MHVKGGLMSTHKMNKLLEELNSLKESAKGELIRIEMLLEFYSREEIVKQKYERQRIIQRMHIRSLNKMSELIVGTKEPIAATMSN